jgi:hypothetical protein
MILTWKPQFAVSNNCTPDGLHAKAVVDVLEFYGELSDSVLHQVKE